MRAAVAGGRPDSPGDSDWDSVEHLNLILALEMQFGIEFEPEEIEQMKSIGQIALLVESKAG